MEPLYQRDLAYVQAVGFGALAEGAATEIVRRLKRCSLPIRRVLDVGCGAGPLARALTEAGFDVTGVDPSAALLEFACATAPKARFLQASAYDIEIRDCDAVLAVGEPLTYRTNDAAGGNTEHDELVRRFFQGVAEGLPAGGMLILDVIGLGEPSLAGRTWRSGDDWAVLSETTENQAERTLVRNIETFRRVGDFYRRSRELHRVQLFDIQRLGEELGLCGFAIETAQSYGAQQLPPRRHAFFATRLAKG